MVFPYLCENLFQGAVFIGRQFGIMGLALFRGGFYCQCCICSYGMGHYDFSFPFVEFCGRHIQIPCTKETPPSESLQPASSPERSSDFIVTQATALMP